MSRQPWKLDGPVNGPDPAGVGDAVRRLHEGRPGPATDEDRPPVSILPMTKAARAALELYYGGVRPSREISGWGTARACGLG